jgi:hypothetical protein
MRSIVRPDAISAIDDIDRRGTDQATRRVQVTIPAAMQNRPTSIRAPPKPIAGDVAPVSARPVPTSVDGLGVTPGAEPAETPPVGVGDAPGLTGPVGDALGEGETLGVGLGEWEGVGLGEWEGVGLGEWDGVGLGEWDGVGLGDGLGVGGVIGGPTQIELRFSRPSLTMVSEADSNVSRPVTMLYMTTEFPLTNPEAVLTPAF